MAEKEREIFTHGDRVLFFSVRLREKFPWCKDYTDPLPLLMAAYMGTC